jgi:serine/threonine protein kinase
MESQETTISTWEKANFADRIQNEVVKNNTLSSSNTSHYQNVYEEIIKIGEGGFGQVYRARNKFDGKEYAVKKILLTGIEFLLIKYFLGLSHCQRE